MGWPFLALGSYVAAALIGSFIPVNNGWIEPKSGIPIFVETNGVHVSLIVPMSAVGTDLSDLIRPDQFSDQVLVGTHVMIGWGHGGVYQNGATWKDVRIADVASAVLGSDLTMLHVYRLTNPQPSKYRRMIIVSPIQFRRIISQIRASFRLNDQGMTVAYAAYAANNVFYESHGHYSALNTCNNWTGSVLRNAGIRVGIWTPLPGGVMRWFNQPTMPAMHLDR